MNVKNETIFRHIFFGTFWKERTDKEAEGNGCHGETQQKQENNDGIGLPNDTPLVGIHCQEQCHDGWCDQQEYEVLGEPSRPMQPAT